MLWLKKPLELTHDGKIYFCTLEPDDVPHYVKEKLAKMYDGLKPDDFWQFSVFLSCGRTYLTGCVWKNGGKSTIEPIIKLDEVV